MSSSNEFYPQKNIQFQWLSFDVQLTILNSLEPLDILRLRKTCKTLHRISSERIVWINALRRVCIRNTIFMPTFPIHDMSQSALEYAATGPERFLRTAAKFSLPRPRSHRIIQQHDHAKFIEVFLVPGGRYLVTVNLTTVAVWDLGIPGNSTVTQGTKPIATQPTHPNFRMGILLFHPTDDGRGLTILINYERVETLRFTIFRIYPSDEFPSLKQIAEVDVPPPLGIKGASFCSLSRNKVIYLLGSTLNVWDYAEDAWACIQVASDYEQIMVSESAILLPYRLHVLIWKMPPLSTSKPLFSGSPSIIPPTFTLKIPSNQMVVDCRGPCDWYSGSPQPLVFDFSYGDKFQTFEVVHKNENFSDSVVTTQGEYRDRFPVFECRFCNDSLVSWWVRAGNPEAHVATFPSVADSHSPDPIDSAIPLFDWSEEFRVPSFTCSLCPFSGRFAWAYDPNGVKVVDYFSESLPVLSNPRKQDDVLWKIG